MALLSFFEGRGKERNSPLLCSAVPRSRDKYAADTTPCLLPHSWDQHVMRTRNVADLRKALSADSFRNIIMYLLHILPIMWHNDCNFWYYTFQIIRTWDYIHETCPEDKTQRFKVFLGWQFESTWKSKDSVSQSLSDIREDYLWSLFCIFLWYLVNILGTSRGSLIKYMKLHTMASKWPQQSLKTILPLQACQYSILRSVLLNHVHFLTLNRTPIDSLYIGHFCCFHSWFWLSA